MLDFLRQSVGPNISIKVDILPEVRPVKIDANQLELALMNLAVNARDAMPKGGSLTITCRNEATRGQNGVTKALLRGEYVRIDVADTGGGLTDEERERLFTPYYTTKQHGTGLGLAIVQSVIADHSGRVWVDSAPGRGSTFHIELPDSGGASPQAVVT